MFDVGNGFLHSVSLLYCKDEKSLFSYLANEERPKEREDNEQKALLQPSKTNKKRYAKILI